MEIIMDNTLTINQYKTFIKKLLSKETPLEEVISDVQYEFPENTTVTVCTITIFGYHITESEACVFKDVYDVDIGKQYAYEAACTKAYALLGFLYKFLDSLTLESACMKAESW